MMRDPLIDLPGYALRRAATATSGELANLLKPLDLRLSEASALMLLGENPGLTSSRIGEVMGIQRANMVPFIARLEAAGLIERDPIDGRTQAILLTESGEAKRQEAHRIVNEYEQSLMDRVPAAHRDHLLPALRALWV